jgi:hypothetical protein
MASDFSSTVIDDGVITGYKRLYQTPDGINGNVTVTDEDTISGIVEINAQKYTLNTSASVYDQSVTAAATLPWATPFAFARFDTTNVASESNSIAPICGFNIAFITYFPSTSTSGGTTALPTTGNPRYMVAFTNAATSKDSYVVQTIVPSED